MRAAAVAVMDPNSRIYAVLKAGAEHDHLMGASYSGAPGDSSISYNRNAPTGARNILPTKPTPNKPQPKSMDPRNPTGAKKLKGVEAANALKAKADKAKGSKGVTDAAAAKKAAAKLKKNVGKKKGGSAASSPASSRDASPAKKPAAGKAVTDAAAAKKAAAKLAKKAKKGKGGSAASSPASSPATSRDASPAKPRPASPTRQGALKNVKAPKAANKEDFKMFEDEIERFDKDREKDFTAYKQAEDEAAKCIEARKTALKTFKKEMQGDADRIIKSLADGLKEKIQVLNDLQAKLAQGESDQGALAALQSQLDEAKQANERLKQDIQEARDNGKRETDEASSKLKADLAAEVLAHAEDQEKDKAKIEELTKKLDDKADEMAKCGQEDQAKYDALEAQLKEKMAEYQALHKKVCDMLGDFNLPSGNSAV